MTVKSKMVELVKGLDIDNLEELWNKTEGGRGRGYYELRDVIMSRLMEIDEGAFEQWVDTDDFNLFRRGKNNA